MHDRTRLLTVWLATTTAIAHAEIVRVPVPDPTPDPVTTTSGFVLLDPQDGQSKLGVDAAYYLVDADDVTVTRFSIHGQFVDPASRFGGYMALPLAYVSDNGDSIVSLGNLELGGVYMPRMSSRDIKLVLHAGATLPTGDNDADAISGFFVAFMRPADIYQALPRSSTIRFGASPLYRSGNVFARLDAGLDINVYVDDSDDTADPAIHLGVGVGYDSGSFAVGGELSVVSTTGDNGSTISVAGISVRGTKGTLRPYGAVVVPLDDDVSRVFDVGLVAGVEGSL